MRSLLLISALAGLTACNLCAEGEVCDNGGGGGGDGSSTDGPDGTDGSGGTIGVEYTDHCGIITGTEVWTAIDSPHRLSCNVQIEGGSVTIEAGADVRAGEGTSITVGDGDLGSSLFVEGTVSQPVVFSPEDPDGLPGSWSGILLAENTDAAAIRGARVINAGRNAAGAVTLRTSGDLRVEVSNTSIEGASGCGLEMRSGAGLSGASANITIEDTAGPPVCARSYNVHTVPAEGSSYSGAENYIQVSDNEMEESVTWENLGIPYGVLDTINVGRPIEPAILTIEAGTTVAFDENQGLELSTDGNASGLIANGTAAEPVTFTGLGSQEPGAWVGIVARQGVDLDNFILRHTIVDYAGLRKAAILVEDATLLADHLTVQNSYKAGVGLQRSGTFHEDSTHLVSVAHAQEPLYLTANAVGFIPQDGLQLDSDDDIYDFIKVVGTNNDVTRTQTWKNLGMYYFVQDADVEVNGSAVNPTTLTIDYGVKVYIDANRKIAFGRDGEASLVIGGSDCATSTEDPTEILGGANSAPGSWLGIQFFSNFNDDTSCIGNLIIDGATGTGAVRVSGTNGQPQVVHFDNVEINNLPDDSCPVWANTHGDAVITNSSTDHRLGWGPFEYCITP